MFIVITFVLGIVLMAAITIGVLPLVDFFHSSNSQIAVYEIATIQRAVYDEGRENLKELYKLNSGYAFPDFNGTETNARINVSKPQNRYLSFLRYYRYQHLETTFNYRPSSDINLTVRSPRSIIWFESPLGGVALGRDAYIEHNTCPDPSEAGSKSAMTAPRWCGAKQSLWSKLEVKDSHYEMILTEQQRLYRVSRKLYQALSYAEKWNEEFGYWGSSRSLASLVGVSEVDPKNCTGNHSLEYGAGPAYAVFECQDLFNAWGEPLHLYLENPVSSVNPEHVYPAKAMLSSKTGIEKRNNDGSFGGYVYIGEDINMELVNSWQ